MESNHTERILSGVIRKLNEERKFNIDGYVVSDIKVSEDLPYNPWTVNVKFYNTYKYFIKRVSNKL